MVEELFVRNKLPSLSSRTNGTSSP